MGLSNEREVMRLRTAIGDPTRLELIFLLGEHEPMNVGEIASNFRLSRPAISHHLSGAPAKAPAGVSSRS